MLIQVQRWGNSLAVRIPRAFAAEAGLKEGTSVNIAVDDGDIRLRPVQSPRYALKDLVDRITSENLHGEVVTGLKVGREEW